MYNANLLFEKDKSMVCVVLFGGLKKFFLFIVIWRFKISGSQVDM